jgi:YggT family protein
VHIAYLIVEIYLYVLIVRIILSWFPISTGSPFMPVVKVLSAVTDPVLNPLRRILPPFRVGGMGIDLSPMVLCLVLVILLQILA